MLGGGPFGKNTLPKWSQRRRVIDHFVLQHSPLESCGKNEGIDPYMM
jgi:hypothetical protein